MKSPNALHKTFVVAFFVFGFFAVVMIANAVVDPHATFPGEAQGSFKREPYVLETPVGYHVVWEVAGKCDKADYSYASVPKIGPYDDYEGVEWGGGAGECIFDGTTSYCSVEFLKESMQKPVPYYVQVGTSACELTKENIVSQVIEIN